MLIVPEPQDPAVPILPPQRPDSQPYRYSMLYNGGRTRAYADTTTELCMALLGGDYTDLSPIDQWTRRYRHCKQVQVWLQAAINAAVSVRPLLRQASVEERAVLLGGRAHTVVVPDGVWSSPIPLVLITSEYAPITTVPRPVSRPPADVDDPLVWLDPTTEHSFLMSLHQATAISLSESAPGPLPTRIAPGYPYDPQRGDGLRWLPGRVELWEAGELVAEAEQPLPSAERYWRTLAMGYDFPTVTHWVWSDVERFQVRIAEPAAAEPDWEPNPFMASGTIQFGNETQPVLTWSATREHPDAPWVIAVPLPPDAAEPTLPLQIALAHAVWQLVVGDQQEDGWREIAAVFPDDQLHTMLPDEQGPWWLAGQEGPVRAVWAWGLGMRDREC